MSNKARYIIQRVSDGLVLVSDSFHAWELSMSFKPNSDPPDHSLLRWVPLYKIVDQQSTFEKSGMCESQITELTEDSWSKPAKAPYKPGELRVLTLREITRYVAEHSC